MRQEMFTLSGTPDFTPFGEFKISPIHDIYVVFEVYICVGVHSGLDCVVRRYYVTCLDLFSKPSRTDLYLDTRLLIIRTDAQD